MKLGPDSTIVEVALTVGTALRARGIQAVLTGGACVSVYTDGSYMSKDADFIIQSRVTQETLDYAMGELGFARDQERYLHDACPFYVEFPPGPLSIGGDTDIMAIELPFRGGTALAISATDSCRDRLAAFYHWRDIQSLQLAVAVARHQQVDFRLIKKWSIAEGCLKGYEEFRRELARTLPDADPGGRR